MLPLRSAGLAGLLLCLGLPAAASRPHVRSLAHAAPARIAPAHSHAHTHAAAAEHTRRQRSARQVPQPAHRISRQAARTQHASQHPAHTLGRHAARLARTHARESRSVPAHHPALAALRPAPVRPQLPDVMTAASENLTIPRLYNERGRLVVPAALVGSHEILLHQNEMATADGLGRIQDDADLDAMVARGMLAALPASGALAVDPRLPGNRRYARPWTVQFLQDLAREHFYRFHAPLQLTSAVRTVAFQQALMHRNGNAAPADGDTASPHLTGQAIDLGKRGMSLPEIAWIRGYLLPLIEAGKIDVEEEFKQSCFHISVYRRYAPQLPDLYNVASRGTVTSAVPSATVDLR